jgi:hypothetical protein
MGQVSPRAAGQFVHRDDFGLQLAARAAIEDHNIPGRQPSCHVQRRTHGAQSLRPMSRHGAGQEPSRAVAELR